MRSQAFSSVGLVQRIHCRPIVAWVPPADPPFAVSVEPTIADPLIVGADVTYGSVSAKAGDTTASVPIVATSAARLRMFVAPDKSPPPCGPTMDPHGGL